MKTLAKSIIVTFPLGLLILLLFGKGELPMVAASFIFLGGYLIFREIESAKKRRYCRTPETRDWLHMEHNINYIIFSLACIIAGLLSTLLRGYIEIFFILVLLLAHHVYSLILWKKTLPPQSSAPYKPLKATDLCGMAYRLPAWRSLPKKLRIRLLKEAYSKVPATGETHLYLYEGLFHTKVHIVSTSGETPCLEGIPAMVLKELVKYPVRESRLARWTDRVHLITQSPAPTAG